MSWWHSLVAEVVCRLRACFHTNQMPVGLQAAAEACHISGYDAPRLLSLVHLAQLLSIEAADASNYTAGVQRTAAGTFQTIPQCNS